MFSHLVCVLAVARATPPVLVQFGAPRTATTLQFQLLCAATCLRFGPTTTCACNCDPAPAAGRDRPTVCKFHELKLALRAAREPGARLFVTTATGAARQGPGLLVCLQHCV